ncbi:MAG: hypothetical protein K0S76_2484 [Herbinix sp.]|jgi:glucosamine--fructose-6-phosphate aminotransferase (isomerizing)|nr:hypothetical protein [Herbinix sp.]
MCGIVGYTGTQKVAPILLDGLSKLEYRGYDSAGLAVFDGTKINTVKAKGRLQVLSDLTKEGSLLEGFTGIGHTRWATHGAPSETNSHPHYNEDQTIAVVHNGIIENYLYLKSKLISKGYHFQSETDTEVIAHLLDYYYKENPLEAISKVVNRLEGSFALGILFTAHPDELYAIRKDSPLIVGVSESGNFIASDVPAILKYTRDVYYIDNKEIVLLKGNNVTFYNIDCEVIQKELTTVNWDISAAEKGGYEHFMLKEIYEQPKALRDTIQPRIKDNDIVIDELSLSPEEIRNLRKIYFVACGSANHICVTGKYVMEGVARIPVEVDLASEFRYREPIFEPNTLLVVVSQSGETADTLAALREAQAHGVKVLGICNVVGSTIAREADDVMYTWAGPEIAVATTKAYSTQLAALYLLAMYFGKTRQTLADSDFNDMLKELQTLPDKVQSILEHKDNIQHFANRYIGARDIFFIGRGIDYAASLEGSLKMKEISYIHSEAYAAGELKHGTISLVEEGTLVAAILTQEHLYKKMISNIEEVVSRGAFVLAVTNEDNTAIEKSSDYVIYIPRTNRYFATCLANIPLQLFGYYVAVGRGCDVDKPRNLAKSVTVE